MLTLPIKKKWFDMIEQGIKHDEYRAITPYYITRFANLYGISEQRFIDMVELSKRVHQTIIASVESKLLCLRAGYSSDSPTIKVKAFLLIGEGKVYWGVEPGVTYFCLRIEEVLEK